MQDLNNIIESLLFAAEEPLSLDKLRGIIEIADSKEIRAALQTLADGYEQRGGGFRLQEVGGGWQIRSRPEYHEWIKRMLQPSPQRLSKAALETLAVVAYNQPVIRADIEHIRGVDCGGVLRQLMERKLVRVLGRREIAGRPMIYATTKLFLEMFDLKDLNDLPSPKEIAELSGERESAPHTGATESEPLVSPSSPVASEDANDFYASASTPDDSDASVPLIGSEKTGEIDKEDYRTDTMGDVETEISISISDAAHHAGEESIGSGPGDANTAMETNKNSVFSPDASEVA